MNKNMKKVCQWCFKRELPMAEAYYKEKGNICPACDARIGQQSTMQKGLRNKLVEMGIIGNK